MHQSIGSRILQHAAPAIYIYIYNVGFLDCLGSSHLFGWLGWLNWLVSVCWVGLVHCIDCVERLAEVVGLVPSTG